MMRMTPTTYGAFLSTLSLRRATGKLPKPLTDCVFLSTLSLRRATLTTVLHWYHISISIHALLAESDRADYSQWTPPIYFYPRSPCGERRARVLQQKWPGQFLSTLSLRRATLSPKAENKSNRISIHALLAESDPVKQEITILAIAISIHALLAESD